VAVVATYLALRSSGVPLAVTDFEVYRLAARAAWHGVDLYAIDTAAPQSSAYPFTYPPVAALVLLPTTAIAQHAAFVVWSVLSTLAMAWVITQVVPRSTPRRALVVAAAVAVASTTSVLRTNLDYGQVNLALMALCFADLRRADSSRLPRGLLVGFAAALKLTPGLFIVYFAITGQWRLLRWSVIGAAAATLLGAFVYPRMTATFFGHTIWGLDDRVDLGHPLDYWGNTSLTGALAAIGARPLAGPVVLATAALTLAAARRLHRRGRELDAWLVVGLAAPLLSPFTWGHHHVYLLPAVLRVALLGGTRTRTTLAALIVALHWKPRLGDSWLHEHPVLLLVPGVVQREILLLSALGCIALLVRSANGAAAARPTTTATPGCSSGARATKAPRAG